MEVGLPLLTLADLPFCTPWGAARSLGHWLSTFAAPVDSTRLPCGCGAFTLMVCNGDYLTSINHHGRRTHRLAGGE